MDSDERDRVAEQFGVAPGQVERDHLISQLLAFLGQRFGDRIHFIGGTALARTHLPKGRLSEDVDLVAIGNRQDLAAELNEDLPRSVARTHGRLALESSLIDSVETLAAIVRSARRPVGQTSTSIVAKPDAVANGAADASAALQRRSCGRIACANPACVCCV
jgi:hypothetical protein